MQEIIPGWVHRPGAHCASTAISDAMTFHGHPLSEAVCFGLGCGLGFAYVEGDFMSPTRMTATRNRLLEPRFFENIGRPFAWTTVRDRGQSLARAQEHLRAGRPVLVRADLAHLPYYNSNTHFAGHVILLWGTDDEARTAFVADTHFEGLQPVSYDDLEKARYSGMGYINNTGESYAVEAEPFPEDLRPVFKLALRAQAEDLLGGQGAPGIFGLGVMERTARTMAEWGRAKDWQWCARWFYQVIERRGTGGGAFRLLYATFLKEAAESDPEIATIAPASEMRDIARAWTELSEALKEVSGQDDPGRLAKPAAMLEEIARREKEFFLRVRERTQSARA